MSERGSFVTQYINCEDCLEAAKSVLIGRDKYLCSAMVPSWLGEDEFMPIIAGKLGGLRAGEELHKMSGLIDQLQPLLCCEMRICVLAESGEEIFTVKPGK